MAKYSSDVTQIKKNYDHFLTILDVPFVTIPLIRDRWTGRSQMKIKLVKAHFGVELAVHAPT